MLVATDVAARGLDIKHIQNVVNFEASKNIETHVHRIGRTGRMGVDGVRYIFFVFSVLYNNSCYIHIHYISICKYITIDLFNVY